MIIVDHFSAVPPFEQVRAHYAALIGAGKLVPGERLPTVRELADQLNIAPNTVARSYRELEAAGLIETRGRAGTVVSARGDQARERLVAAAEEYATAARDLAVDPREALQIVTAALNAR